MENIFAAIVVAVLIIGGIVYNIYRDTRSVKRGRYTNGKRTRSAPYRSTDTAGGTYGDVGGDSGGCGGGGGD